MGYFAERHKFRSLPIPEQLSILEQQSNESNAMIGEIYLASRFLEVTAQAQNERILADLLENAALVKAYGMMGMGDTEFRWIFSTRNLLIGISGVSHRSGPILVGGNYKVYRMDHGQTNTVDLDQVAQVLFAC